MSEGSVSVGSWRCHFPGTWSFSSARPHQAPLAALIHAPSEARSSGPLAAASELAPRCYHFLFLLFSHFCPH